MSTTRACLWSLDSIVDYLVSLSGAAWFADLRPHSEWVARPIPRDVSTTNHVVPAPSPSAVIVGLLPLQFTKTKLGIRLVNVGWATKYVHVIADTIILTSALLSYHKRQKDGRSGSLSGSSGACSQPRAVRCSSCSTGGTHNASPAKDVVDEGANGDEAGGTDSTKSEQQSLKRPTYATVLGNPDMEAASSPTG